MNPSDWRAHGWSLGSQALSSGRSIGFALVCAVLLEADQFGLVAIVMGTAIAANGLLRAAALHPIALLDDAPEGDVLSGAVRYQAILASALGAIGVMVAVLAQAPGALIVGAACFPLVAVHDAVRIAALNLGRGALAAVVDGVWVVGLGLAVAGIAALGDDRSTVALIVSWGVTAGVSGAALLVIDRIRRRAPAPVAVSVYADTHGRLGRRLAVQLFLETIPTRMLPLLVAALIAVREAGSLRGAESLLGGATIIWSAISLSVLRQARVRARNGDDRAVLGFVARTMALPVVAVLLNAGAALALTDSLGERLLGDTWAGSIDLLPVVAALLAAQVVLGVVATAQRATHRDDEVRSMLAIGAAGSLVVVPLAGLLGGIHQALLADALCLFVAAAIGAWRLAAPSDVGTGE